MMPSPLQTGPVPSARALAMTTAGALVAALVILVTIVLPAEYNRDPLGTGRALGLTRLANPPAPAPSAPMSASELLVPVQRGAAAVYAKGFKTDATQFVLGPYEFVEYRYHLEKGASMLYSWSATAVVIHEFHGDRDGTSDEPVSYVKDDRREESASFTAPFSGIHGWYWENPGAEPITVSIRSVGFYASALEFRSDHTRRPHDLMDGTVMPGRSPQ